MIKLSFIVPHSPILIPNIGKKNSSILKRTTEAFLEMRSRIEEKIDTIIIFSPHNEKNSELIEINDHFQLDINFEKFGDYFSRLTLDGNVSLSYKIKEECEKISKVSLVADKKINYGAGIPLYLLLSEGNRKIANFRGKIIIINSTTKQSLQEHFDFGKQISRILNKGDEKIALIASAELSHRLSQRSPGGFYQRAEAFDNKIIELIKKGKDKVPEILNMNKKSIQEAKECGLRPISILLGAIYDKDYQATTLSYQKDLGVGYLSMDINLK